MKKILLSIFLAGVIALPAFAMNLPEAGGKGSTLQPARALDTGTIVETDEWSVSSGGPGVTQARHSSGMTITIIGGQGGFDTQNSGGWSHAFTPLYQSS